MPSRSTAMIVVPASVIADCRIMTIIDGQQRLCTLLTVNIMLHDAISRRHPSIGRGRKPIASSSGSTTSSSISSRRSASRVTQRRRCGDTTPGSYVPTRTCGHVARRSRNTSRRSLSSHGATSDTSRRRTPIRFRTAPRRKLGTRTGSSGTGGRGRLPARNFVNEPVKSLSTTQWLRSRR